MDTFRELLDSLKTHVRDRVSNPLYAAFIISWGVFNYRLLMVLLGDGSWRDKIAFIDSTLYPTPEQSFQRGFMYPLLASALFVLLAPFVRRWVTVFIGERDRVTTAELLRVAGETPLSPEKADALRQGLLDERQRRIDEKRALEAKVSELNSQVDLLVEQASQRHPLVRGHDDDKPDAQPPYVEKLDPPVLPLRESDFIGGQQKYVIQVAQAGLTVDQARALYAVRNEQHFDADEVTRALGYHDEYIGRVTVDKLQGFGLIGHSGRPNHFVITSLGRQALAAVINRGFKPT